MVESRQRRRGVVVLVVALSVVGLALAPGVLAQTGNGSGAEGSFGAQVSSFMQSTAADTDGSIDRGMWNASVTDGADPAAAVTGRTARLRDRLRSLQNRSEALAAARENGTLSEVAYTARASAVHARLANLRAAVNQAATTAQRHGIEASGLAELHEMAGNATGPEIAATARNLTNAGQGPPPGVSDPGDGTGPPADQGNGTDGGPPDDVPGNGDNETSGPPTDNPGSGDGDPGGGQAGGADGGDRGNGGNGAPSGGSQEGNGKGAGDGGPPNDGNENGGVSGDDGAPGNSGGNGGDDGDDGAPGNSGGNGGENSEDGAPGNNNGNGGGDGNGAPGNSGEGGGGTGGGPGNSGGSGGSNNDGAPGNGGGNSGSSR